MKFDLLRRFNPASEIADLHGAMSDARSHLGRALFECQWAHDTLVASSFIDSRPSGPGCACTGCTIRRSIELALGDLEGGT